ncbi:molybdopterin oxidoreductase family protein [Streptomyces sp. NBC_00996]|uniref:molybdopterin oxidoreductase family protein n=1 Tax=Streptomyces sp. NBC_00996 TaxID=2903710 RepID=UPI003869F5C6|nr:molybdopterin-dependent oxidoreductase [Streptomyces sp. NBC_00996]
MSGHTPEAYARLTQPLVRDSRDEPFRQADWDEALTRVAQGLSRARGAFGMFSRAHATSEMNYVAGKFARAVMGKKHVDIRDRLVLDAGTEIPMAHAIGREIIRAGLADHASIERATTGFEEYRQLVEPWTPSLAEKVTGVPAPAIRELARAYARGERALPRWTPGGTEHHERTDTVGALSNLSLLTGHDHGPGTTEMFEVMEENSLKAVYCIGEDPVQSAADSEQAIRRLRALDFLVVQDTFLTRTAESADVVLPGTGGWAETDGTAHRGERRVQRVGTTVTPPGEARDDIAIIRDLATHLGHEWQYADAEAVHHGPRPTSPGERDLRTPFRLVRHDPPVDLTDERYPIRLTTGRRLDPYNTGAHSGSSPSRRGECVELCPQDAEHYGVVVGEEVQVCSRRGSVVAPVWVDTALRPGLAFTTMYLPNGVDTDRKNNGANCPIVETVEFRASAIRIEKLPVAAVRS